MFERAIHVFHLSPLEAVSFTYNRPKLITETDLDCLDARFLNPDPSSQQGLMEHDAIKEKENVGYVLNRSSMEVEGAVEESVDQTETPQISDNKTVDDLRELSTKQVKEFVIMLARG